MTYFVSKPSPTLEVNLQLTGSKSISNRLLLIQALSEKPFTIENCSTSDDSETIKRVLNERPFVIDVGPSGAAIRFLAAYFATQPREWTLQGTARLHERPIAPLVEALRTLGADIIYKKGDDRAPLLIRGRALQANAPLSLDATQSSQFASALLLIAPTLPTGLTLRLEGDRQSEPYLMMTLSLMEQCGASIEWLDQQTIRVEPTGYQPPASIQVESDWSSVAFWYALAALSENRDVRLQTFFPHSIQGDSALMEIMQAFGVETDSSIAGEIRLTKSSNPPTNRYYERSFKGQPDLVPYLVVMSGLLGKYVHFSDTAALMLKESDRLLSLKTELIKLGVDMDYSVKGLVTSFDRSKALSEPLIFDTYGDHRIAMALCEVAMTGKKVGIRDAEVVTKSYPEFWHDLEKAGFVIERPIED